MRGDLTREIARARWYHTINLPSGPTAGEYDLRAIVQNLPWPNLDGMRCLDVGSRDGFYAFEMERRGAREVISLDLASPEDIHFPAVFSPDYDVVQKEIDDGNRAFSLAREALGSAVERMSDSIYRLDPEDHGCFDFAVMGTLLLHLRDPVAALTAVNGVLQGQLLLNEPIEPSIDLWRRQPVARLYMQGGPFWFVMNPPGLRRTLHAAGFRAMHSGRPYIVPYGQGETRARPSLAGTVLGSPWALPRRLVSRRGMLHQWILAGAEQ